MQNYYAQVAVASKTGETADVMVNTFAVQHAGTLSDANVTAWQTALTKFYNAVVTSGGLCGRAETGHSSKFLKATQSVPNYPLFTRSWGLATNPAATDLPQEVALCASYSADQYPLVPRARRRGRIYLSGYKASGNSGGRPTTGVYEGLANAYAAYATDVLAIPDIAPGVWSRVSGDVYLIDRVWCDNEWDTMRSRGGKSTARKTVTV